MCMNIYRKYDGVFEGTLLVNMTTHIILKFVYISMWNNLTIIATYKNNITGLFTPAEIGRRDFSFRKHVGE